MTTQILTSADGHTNHALDRPAFATRFIAAYASLTGATGRFLLQFDVAMTVLMIVLAAQIIVTVVEVIHG
jgi:hypothetical protein